MSACDSRSARRTRNNSSPQGDGNRVLDTMLYVVQVKQFIPARGRKPVMMRAEAHRMEETIHPRKGTETWNAAQEIRGEAETIHPRKGTETYFMLVIQRVA